jgi:DUF4097 and DUF4098 domain-containing protein YvlB
MATWEQTYPLAQGGGVQVKQRNGRVSVEGWNEPTVKLIATSGLDEEIEDRLSVTTDGNGIHIQVEGRRGFFIFDGSAIDLQVMVPTGAPCRVESGSGAIQVRGTLAALEAETGSGRIEIFGVGHASLETGSGAVRAEKVNGALDVETGSGSVELYEINGSVSVEAGSGHVTASKVKGNLNVETGSGRLQVADVYGRVELETGSGSAEVDRVKGQFLGLETGGGALRLSGIDVGQLELDSSSGRVELDLAAVYPGGSYSIDTGSGSVVVAIPPDAGLEVRADTSSGKVTHSGLAFEQVQTGRGEFRGVLNRGGAVLVIDAGSGGVQLRAGQSAGPAQAAPVAPTAAVASVGGAQVLEAVKGDPALEHSEQLRRIVAMVEEGKLTPTEAEELLRALDDEEETAQ